MKRSNRLFRWELSGFFFIFLLGALWHYGYDWTRIDFMGLIAPINNSVWEHTKMGVFPTVLFALLAYPASGRDRPGYWVVRAVEVYIIPLLMIAIFYSYTAVLGNNFLVMDILLFAVAVTIGQLISYHWLRNWPGTKGSLAGVLSIIVIMGLYAYLSNHPLPIQLFYTY